MRPCIPRKKFRSKGVHLLEKCNINPQVYSAYADLDLLGAGVHIKIRKLGFTKSFQNLVSYHIGSPDARVPPERSSEVEELFKLLKRHNIDR